MDRNIVVEFLTRKAWRFGFLAGVALVLVFHLPSATFAQDGIDRVTGFPRECRRLACRQKGRGQLRIIRRGVRLRPGPGVPP